MKTGQGVAPAVDAVGIVEALRDAPPADARLADDSAGLLPRARGFAQPLLAGQTLDSGEDAQGHADGVAAILAAIGAAPAVQAAAYLVYAGDFLQRPEDTLARNFGPGYAELVVHTRKLMLAQRAMRDAQVRAAAAAVVTANDAEQRAQQTERVRKMLLAFSRDLRVVLLRLASRLQTLRWHASSKTACPAGLAAETMEVVAPLANRLGIWQIKWELEDLSFRFLQPEAYRQLAGALAERRVAREASVEAARTALAALLQRAGIAAQVYGRPKHLYSIWKKMRGKDLALDQVFDMRALRVVVGDIDACYAALAVLHAHWPALAGQYDDYIARPKPNGYQSLHTVVLGDDGRPMEVQVRSAAMHEHAEHGVAAHWAYKEAGTRGYAGVNAVGSFEERLAEARKAVLRQLLAWERDFVGPQGAAGQDASAAGPAAVVSAQGADFSDRIYVFTPQSRVIELSAGATPIDFAYALHTELGHRCRGARVDGQMVPLHTPLANGQTVEIIAAKEGSPSLDWLNPELGYLKSPRARSKVRAWFNLQATQATIARGRELVDKLLQREGRTAVKLDELAAQLGFKGAEALFEVVGKDEFSLRHIEALLRPAPTPPAESPAEAVALKRARVDHGRGHDGGVLVVGVESLLTQLARCCRPAPPDTIGGYVTRGKGVAIHRQSCANFRQMAASQPERVIAVAWGQPPARGEAPVYAVDIHVEAADRAGLLRDLGEVLAKDKTNVIGVHTQTIRQSAGATALMIFTVELPEVGRLAPLLQQMSRVAGVRHARRR